RRQTKNPATVRGCAMEEFRSASRWWRQKRGHRSQRRLSMSDCRLEDRLAPSTGIPAIVSDINTLGAPSSPSQFVDVNGTLFFTANDGFSGTELWKTTGRSATRVADIAPGAASSNPLFLVNVNGTLFFQANDGTTGAE